MSTLVKGLKRLTAQSLKFRVCLSSLGAENINAKEQVYLSVKRSKSNKKEISTANAVVDNTGKVEWKDELVQIVTIYFQFGEGNLQPAKKGKSSLLIHYPNNPPCIHYRTPYRGTVRLTTVRPYCTDAGRGVRAETLGETATTPLAGFTQLEAPNLQSLSMNEGFSASHSAF